MITFAETHWMLNLYCNCNYIYHIVILLLFLVQALTSCHVIVIKTIQFSELSLCI